MGLGRTVRRGEVLARILVHRVEREDRFATYAHDLPIGLGQGGFWIVEKAVDLALYTFAGHGGRDDTRSRRSRPRPS